VLGSGAAQVPAGVLAAETSEGPKLPLLVVPAQEGVRTLSVTPIEIDLTPASVGTVSKGASPTAAESTWKSTFVVQPTVNPNATLKVTVQTQSG